MASPITLIKHLFIFSVGALAFPFDLVSDKGGQLEQRSLEIDTDKCSPAQATIIRNELNVVRNMIGAATGVISSTDYYKYFFDEKNQGTPGFDLQVKTKYTKLKGLNTDADYDVKLICQTTDEDQEKYCKIGKTYRIAYTVGKEIGLCQGWFDDSRYVPSATITEQCPRGNKDAYRWNFINQFRLTKAFGLLHEFWHLTYATGRDYAYGQKDCRDLAKGDRTNKQLCGNDKTDPPYQCDQRLTFTNCDTLAFVAAGVYWSNICKKPIIINTGINDESTNQTPDDVTSVGSTVIPITAAASALPSFTGTLANASCTDSGCISVASSWVTPSYSVAANTTTSPTAKDTTTSPTAVQTTTSIPVTVATTTSPAPAATTSAAGKCKAGTLSSTADCDSLCAGGTCQQGSTALGQVVVTCSDCP